MKTKIGLIQKIRRILNIIKKSKKNDSGNKFLIKLLLSGQFQQVDDKDLLSTLQDYLKNLEDPYKTLEDVNKRHNMMPFLTPKKDPKKEDGEEKRQTPEQKVLGDKHLQDRDDQIVLGDKPLQDRDDAINILLDEEQRIAEPLLINFTLPLLEKLSSITVSEDEDEDEEYDPFAFFEEKEEEEKEQKRNLILSIRNQIHDDRTVFTTITNIEINFAHVFLKQKKMSLATVQFLVNYLKMLQVYQVYRHTNVVIPSELADKLTKIDVMYKRVNTNIWRNREDCSDEMNDIIGELKKLGSPKLSLCF